MNTFSGESWTIEDLENFWVEIDTIGKSWGITYPRTQIEVLSSDQLVEVCATVGSPCSYDHWSIGKDAMEQEIGYEKGQVGLPLELIINSDPTIMYIAENNSLIDQGLVMAHAGVGHGSVFKNNYLFKKWTDPLSILDYFSFSRKYIKECELLHGPKRVEELLDKCHALQDFGVSQHRRKRKKEYQASKEMLIKERQAVDHHMANARYKNKLTNKIAEIDHMLDWDSFMEFPEENILYFLEKHSPILEPWEREVIRITRKMAEYFYPQRKTKILHEGWATFIEYMIFEELYKKGVINEGGYLEFLRSHSSVIYQPAYSNPHYSGSINPYAVGYQIFYDLYRMTHSPTKEDEEHYPEICNTDWTVSLMNIVNNYADSDFISRYLTPNVIFNMRLFLNSVDAKAEETVFTIENTANDLEEIRQAFADNLNINNYMPILYIDSLIETPEDNVLHIKLECVKGKEYDVNAIQELGYYIHKLWGSTIKIG